jgi:hypothetical protein
LADVRPYRQGPRAKKRVFPDTSSRWFIAEGSLIGSGCGKAAFKHKLWQWEMGPFFVEKAVRATLSRLTIQQIR